MHEASEATPRKDPPPPEGGGAGEAGGYTRMRKQGEPADQEERLFF